MYYPKPRVARIVSAATLLAVALVAGCTSTHQPAGSNAPTPSQQVSTTDPAADPVTSATVMRRDFRISYQLDAATAAAQALPLRPPPGMRWGEHRATDTVLSVGQEVGQFVLDPAYRAQLAVSATNNRVDAARLARLDQEPSRPVMAPISGKLVVNDADKTVSIAAPGVVVTVPLTGIQQLRMASLGLEGTATVETVAGRRAVRCAYLWIDIAAGTGDTGAATLNCRLPQVVETVGGLRAQLHLTSPVIKDAVVVPDAMLGQDDTGYTVTVLKDGKPEVTKVEVGPGDGVVRVITSPLPVGASLVRPAQ